MIGYLQLVMAAGKMESEIDVKEVRGKLLQ